MTLTLLFREYCSLCHQMRQALLPYQQQYGFALNVVAVDEDEKLVARYNELVPVLLHGEHEICHWHLDEAALSAYLNQVRFKAA